ncbi:ATP-grasp domain-containing protein [Bremerella volcania]|uniref:ATP-grasp domain-containing protein n=1 Tax=Bremerella volcania TaxID=2527984 RepID=UPI0013FD0A0D|nr:ATP-grasp domain-containing protein [Bremerella volcania]
MPDAKRLNDKRIDWLREIGAVELHRALPDATGFLFSYQHGESHLVQQVEDHPGIHDRPSERQELIRLDDILRTLAENEIDVPTPKTWVLEIDQELPDDLKFPLFLRTPRSSWKRGGEQAKVRNLRELADESELLRRAFGWNTPIIARQWLDIAVAGKWMFGNAPQEIRTWVVDGEPAAWSFHYLHAVPNPAGFPLSEDDLSQLKTMAATVAKPFHSRLIVVDFIRDTRLQWHFIEAGPGAVAGTAHQWVFKYVANRLVGKETNPIADEVGGAF